MGIATHDYDEKMKNGKMEKWDFTRRLAQQRRYTHNYQCPAKEVVQHLFFLSENNFFTCFVRLIIMSFLFFVFLFFVFLFFVLCFFVPCVF